MTNNKNRVDTFFDNLKNHRLLKWVIITGTILIALSTFYEKIISPLILISNTGELSTAEIEDDKNHSIISTVNINTVIENQETKERESFNEVNNEEVIEVSSEDPEDGLLTVLLFVNSELSEGTIYINGRKVIPVNNSLTIKRLEMQYVEVINLKVENSQNKIKCSKEISVKEGEHQVKVYCE